MMKLKRNPGSDAPGSRVCQAWLRLVLFLAVSIAASGCGSLEHVRALREAQEDFSELAAEENRKAVSHILPNASDLNRLASDWKAGVREELLTGFGADEYYQLYVAYQNLYLRLQALERRAGADLRADNLYGSTVALELMTFWRMRFFANLLQLDPGKAPSLPESDPEARKVDLLATNAMSEVVARARRVLAVADRENLALYPRDRFMMEAATPLVRYDISYLNAIRFDRSGQLDADRTPLEKVRAQVGQLVEQMAHAERELAEASANQPEHIRYYAALARLTMLRTARTLADKGRVSFLTDEAKELFPMLAKRIEAFHQEAGESGSDATRLLQQLNQNAGDVLPKIGP